jgi:hypothetical protein
MMHALVAGCMPASAGAGARCAQLLSRSVLACNSWQVGRDTRQAASELRAVAPFVVVREPLELVGPCTLVTNGARTVALSSAELLRQAPEPLAIALTLDGKQTVRIASWSMGRIAGVGIAELAEPFPKSGTDLVPLQLAAVSATVDTRGAPAALVWVAKEGSVFVRRAVPVHVDAIDGGGMSDEVLIRLASPDDAADGQAPIDGAPLFAWMPADPVLGRESEVVMVAVGVPYRQQTFKPRANPAIAELAGLEDLGRALPWEGGAQPEGSNELGQVAGEIRDDSRDPE